MVVVKTGVGYRILSESKGKLLPKVYPTREEAEKRVAQLLMYKHMKKAS